MKKYLLTVTAIVMSLVLILFVVGCAGESAAPVAPAAAQEPTPESEPLTEESPAVDQEPTPEPEPLSEEPEERTVTVTDMSGDSVTIIGEVDRIINLWPAGTASFFALGAGDLIVGIATAGTINEWTQLFYPNSINIPELGGTTPSIEELIDLEPDLVIIHPATAADGFAQLIRDVGIPAINIDFSTYETMAQAYAILAEILGGEYQQRLELWISETEAKISNARNLTADISEEERPVVFYIAGQSHSLTTTMNPGSIVDDWVESAGGRHATTLMDVAAADITPEAIFALNPDIFICAGVWQHVHMHELLTTPGWMDLNAVVNERVYTNPYGNFNWDRFGLESQLQINYALMIIQPEIASANGITRESIIDDIISFYSTYAGFELTAQQAEHMLDGLSPDGTMENPVE